MDSRPGVDRTEALRERMSNSAVAALELYTIYLGVRLGLYRALAEGGPASSSQLADRTGTAERYAREWLEQHAVSGLIDVDEPRADPLVRRYRLPAEHIPVLADPDDVRYEAHVAVDLVRAGRRLPQLVDAFRAGNAPPPLPWEPEGRADPNRSRFINLLGNEWLPAIADVDVRLRAEPPARVADVACGTGWSSIAMARAYPSVHVDGVDLDPDAITAARRNAERSGVADRVTFSVADAANLGNPGGYDLVTIFEALHDMSRPVDALGAARQILAQDGIMLVVDGLVNEEFAAPASLRERTEYGWSVVSCLPGAMADPQTAATGAVMRPSVLRHYALQAGFRDVQTLPIDTDYWRFYRLLP
ncbi:SAM-dependent methyltransferase [Jiangella gansuensis]|uniref:SAM-dependent methyltransferase n=1 Tax=Jiangella gansuensis TaxID=281473 RepID=UPI00047AF9D9|nr:class I SAM-dependent methyltransferase [Jiangella gansuensis]